MPDLMALQRDFAPKGFTVIGIAMPYDRPDHVLQMTRERGFNFPIVLDPSGDATHAFGRVSLTPTSFLIAPDGRIAQTVVGELEFDALRRQLQTWLGS
jgi:peroxiredoxin